MLPRITLLTATLSLEGIRIAVDLPALPELPETPLPASAFSDDGLLYLTVSVVKGGAV